MTPAPMMFQRPDIDWTRDRWGRPLVKLPDGKSSAYTRVTTYAGALDDGFNLGQWKLRRVILGMANRPDYVTLASSLSADDRDKAALNDLAEKALEAAGPNKADLGTALHGFTERLDRGEELGALPEMYRDDLVAYAKATAVLTHQHIETRLVCDALEVAGTPDRISLCSVPDPDGNTGGAYIADVKTGRVDYPGKFSTQLAIYSRSVLYDPANGSRTKLNVNQRWGIIIELPPGTGTCRLHWLPLAHGWTGAEMAGPVRAWRKAKVVMQPFPTADVPQEAPERPNGNPTPVAGLSTPEAADQAGADAVESVRQAIAGAAHSTSLASLYTRHAAVWTQELTDLAERRYKLLEEQERLAPGRAALVNAMKAAPSRDALNAVMKTATGDIITTGHRTLYGELLRKWSL